MQVLLTTPTTPNERMEKIAQASEGFIYLVSFPDSVLLLKSLFCYSILPPSRIICRWDPCAKTKANLQKQYRWQWPLFSVSLFQQKNNKQRELLDERVDENSGRWDAWPGDRRVTGRLQARRRCEAHLQSPRRQLIRDILLSLERHIIRDGGSRLYWCPCFQSFRMMRHGHAYLIFILAAAMLL